MNSGSLIAWLPGLALAAAMTVALMGATAARAMAGRWRAGSKVARKHIRKAGRSCS